MSTTPLPEAALAALREGHTIEAIRIVREVRGIGLKDAKDAVDAAIAADPALKAAMPSGGIVSLVRSLFGGKETPRTAPPPAPKFGGMADPGAAPPAEALPPEVLAAIQRRDPITAIKLLREARGIGLREAKDLVDAEARKR